MFRPGFSDIHPLVPFDQQKGWWQMLSDLESMLCEACGFDAFFLQPNSGAQGELAGLATIKNYHASRNDDKRDLVIIPTSAHGTNPASAVLCGYKVIPVQQLKNGDLEITWTSSSLNMEIESLLL